MAQFPNTFEQMMMLDRQRIASFDDALLRNLRLMGSDVPMGNTTFSPGIGFNAPTMYSQVLQGIGGTFGDTAAQTIDLVSGLIKNPAIAPMLGPIPDYLSSIQGLPPIGGAIDPGGFAYSQLYGRIASGREVPQLAPPSNFANRQAIDAYNEQLQNLDYYMMRPSRPEQRLLLPAQNATDNMQLATAFENISRMQQQDINFQNMFALFNEIMPGDRAAAISPDIQAQIRQAATRGDEAAIGNILQDPNIRSVLDRQASLAKNASALMGVSSMLSNFVGSTSAETSQVQGLGDILRQVLKLDQPGLMTAATTQSLAAMGNLGIAQTATMGPQGLPETRSVVGQIAAALQERIRMSGMDALTRGQGSGFFGMQTQGFERTGQLLQELQASGMLTTGGVDIFNAIKPDDVKKMEEAIATQLEGFSEIAKAGRRMGMQIPEITRNLQSIYGGRLPQVLREQAMAEMGGVQAQEMTLVERARERGVSEEAIGLTGSQQRQQFLELEAQRRAGTTMMQQLEKAVELGRFAGIDARGVMAMASTVTQMTQDMGLTGEASTFLTQDALSRVALSRQMGEPITAAQSLAISAGIAERGMKNTSVRSFAALKKAMKDGLPLPQGDVDALIAKFNNNEFVDPDIVSNLIRNAGGIPEAYTSERAMRAAMSDPETMSAVRQRFSSDQNLSVAGTLQRMFESGGAQVDTLVSTVGTNAQLAKQLGIEGDVNFTSIAAAYNRLEGPIAQRDFLTRLEAALPQDQARQITGAFRSLLGANTNNLSVVGDNGRMSPANVILQEESERARFGGQTRAEIGAQAVVDVKRRIEEDMGSGGRTAIADAFKSMMDRAVVAAEQDIKAKGAAGLSDAELQELGRVRATKSVAAGMEAGTIDLTPAQREQLAKLRNIQPDAIDSSLAAAPITNQEAQSLIASKAIDITEAAKAEAAAAKMGTIPLSQAEITQLAERRAASTNFGLSEVLQGLAGTDMGKFSQILGEQIAKVKAELGALDQSSSPEMRRQMETELEGLKAQAKTISDTLKQTAASAGVDAQPASTGRMLRISRDPSRAMSTEEARLEAEAQGVDMASLADMVMASSAFVDDELSPEFDTIEANLRTKAKDRFQQLGADEAKAEIAASTLSFSYEDVEREISSSNLDDKTKAGLKQRLDDFRRRREQAIAAGERVEDELTKKETEYDNAIKLSEITLKDLQEIDKKISDAAAGGGAKTPTIDPAETERLQKELAEIETKKAKLSQELKTAAGPRGDVDARRLGLETQLEGLKAQAKTISDTLSKTAADVEYTLRRDLTIVPDSRREMSPEQAAAKAEEQGVDLNELKLGMSGARERRALQPVEKELREMAYSKAIEAGATKQDAEFVAVSSPFTYDDVYAAIERSSLSDEEKASLKSDIKQYKATRESDLQIGEMVVDKNTNQEAERPKALDLDKVTIEGINEATKGAVKVPVARTSEETERLQKELTEIKAREAKLNEELKIAAAGGVAKTPTIDSAEAEKLNKELTEIKAREAKLNEELKIAAGPRGDVDAKRLGLETQLQNLQGLLTQINKYGPESPEAKAAAQSFVKSLEGSTAVQPEGSPTPQQSLTGQLQGTPVDGTSTAVTISPSAAAPTAGMDAGQPPEFLRRDEETSATEVKPLPVAVRPTQTKPEVPAEAAMSPAAQSLALSGEQVGKITSYLQNEMDKKLIGIQQELASLSTHIRSRT